MRITLSEVSAILGCGRNDILWGTGPFPAVQDLSATGASSCPYTKEIISTDDDIFQSMPWADIFPQGARIDSRQVTPGDLFFCITGNRADGHDFALAAARSGAVGIVAQRDPFAGVEKREDLPPVFLVPDTVCALQRLAASHRDTSTAKVVGVTGTAGKTSVKEVLAQVLAMHGQTEKSPLNKNNGIGLPLSMLGASAVASFWVMEAGISLPEDMDELGRILRPDVALILNVGSCHLEGLGDKGVAHYKSKLLEYVAPYGVGIYSADYPDLEAAVQKHGPALAQDRIDLLTFSTTARDVYCWAVYEGPVAEGLGRFRVFVDGAEHTVEAPFRGEMGGENVAAVVAVAVRLGLNFDEITRGLSTAVLPEQRFASRRLGRFVLVDDSYNANPLSSRRMLEAVREMAVDAGLPLILVMGEMGELGPGAEAAHVLLGRHMAAAGALVVFWKGGLGHAVHSGLRECGFQGAFHQVSGAEEFMDLLERASLAEGLVLFKGSRMNRLEELVRRFSETCAEKKDD